jgi:hypothetical protein
MQDAAVIFIASAIIKGTTQVARAEKREVSV